MIAALGPDVSELDLGTIVVGVLGGLSLFLYGMGQMTDALKAVAGNGMRLILTKLTSHRVLAALTGAFVTAVVQSSSVTTVLLVGFISAGLMTLAQSIGVIMGANVGSTFTAQLIAFNITSYALVLITIGFAALFLGRHEKVRQVGTMIMGLGMIFFGMNVMSEGTFPLRSYEPFIEAMRGMDRPGMAILASAAITAIIQSSAATTGIVIVLASQGFVSLESGIALALGSNIGTCATAVLAALGKPRPAMQAAAAHVLFNVLGVLIWLPFLPQLAEIVRSISPTHADLEGVARMSAETPRQIANAHTFFNVANTLIFIGFTGPMAALVRRIVPDLPVEERKAAEPRFLEEVYLQTPSLALERIRLEASHLGELALAAVRATSPPERSGATSDDRVAFAEVERIVRDFHGLYEATIDYGRRLLGSELTEKESQVLQRMLTVANHYLSIADVIGTNLRALAKEWRERDLKASVETRALAQELHRLVEDCVEDSVAAVRAWDRELGASVIRRKKEVVASSDRLARRLAERLVADDPQRLALYRLESDVIEIYRRIYYFAKRVAKVVAEGVDELEVLPEDLEMPA